MFFSIVTSGKRLIFGNLPVLSACDIEILKYYILENATDGIYIDVEDTIEKDEELRKERFQKARYFLNKIICYSMNIRFSTICVSYCCTFPYLFLNKYRNLFFPEIKYSDVLEFMHAPPFTI